MFSEGFAGAMGPVKQKPALRHLICGIGLLRSECAVPKSTIAARRRHPGAGSKPHLLSSHLKDERSFASAAPASRLVPILEQALGAESSDISRRGKMGVHGCGDGARLCLHHKYL